MIGNALAILAATLFVHQRPTEEAFFPMAVMFHTIPVMAYAPILVLLLGNGLEAEGRDRGADLFLPDAGQHDARPARGQPAAAGVDAHSLGDAEAKFLQAAAEEFAAVPVLGAEDRGERLR